MLDEDDNFDQQKLVALNPPAVLQKGDVLVYRYPAAVASFNCVQ
jgi:hypothetical protein